MNSTVHGFDGVHVTVKAGNKKLWLGESKLYVNGEAGIKELANDLKAHIQADYLRQEFTLITRKLPENIPEIDYWRSLMNKHQKLDTIFQNITIPLVCTYTSEIFTKHTDETKEYIEAFTQECIDLKKILDDHNIVTNIDVLLLLLPVPDKNELNSELDKRLKSMQSL